MNTSDDIVKKLGKHPRLRVMGILIQSDKILLINHQGLNEENELWLPPGGGIEFGESAVVALTREFKEETNLEVG